MDIKKLNELIEQALNEAKSKKFIQIGSFHNDPEVIYVNEKKRIHFKQKDKS